MYNRFRTEGLCPADLYTKLMRSIKSLVRRVFKQISYRMERRQDRGALPDSNLDSIQLVLAYYLTSKPVPTFIQVGACDGKSGDAAHRFISRGIFRSILIEPIEDSFRKLADTYKGVPNVTAIQAAIGMADGYIELFKVKDGATSIDQVWSRQLASFDKKHLLKHGVAESEIERVSVQCLTLASLLEQNGLKHIDVLQIDTEGFDAEIVTMALDLPTPPECIYFENIHLDDLKISAVFEKLNAKGYVWTHDHWNTLAIDSRLRDRWSQTPIQEKSSKEIS